MRKQAFFSFAIIAAVTAALIMFAAYSKSFYGYREVQNYALEARLVDQRANDSQYFLSGMLDDLMVDSGFNIMGCGTSNLSNATDVCAWAEANAAEYLESTANLSGNGITFRNTAGYVFRCGNTTWAPYPQPGNEIFNATLIRANLTANYTVNTTNSKKHIDIVIEKVFALIRSKDWATFNATINTAYGANQSYYVDCA